MTTPPPEAEKLSSVNKTKYPFVAPTPEELEQKIQIALSRAIDPKATTEYRGETYAIEDLPNEDLRAMSGYGHFQPFHRDVLAHPYGKQWTYTPNMCLISSEMQWVWIDPEHLVCPGCGIEGT